MTTPKEFAQLVSTDEITISDRTVRKFFRSPESGISPVGKGKRYKIDGRSLNKLINAFNDWNAPALSPEEVEEAEENYSDSDEEDIIEVDEDLLEV